MGDIIKCIYVEKHAQNGDPVNEMIRRISTLHLLRSYASLEMAAKACLKAHIDILFVRLSEYPVPKKELAMLQKLMKHGIKIIAISHRISVAKDVLTANITDFVSIPTSSRRLWQACIYALSDVNQDIETTTGNNESGFETYKNIF